MRGILQFVAIVAVMVAARYAPLGDAVRWLIRPAPAPAIVTGSIQDQPAEEVSPVVRRTRDAAADVRAILAAASSEKPSNNNVPAPQRRTGSRGREDEVDDDGELYIGGTGLLEESTAAVKDHPLASQNPDDYLVICEAGCRPSSDRVVYKVSKIAAVNAAKAQRKLEVTSAAESADASSENNEIVCIAGCYDDEPVKQRRAESAPVNVPVQTALAEVPSSGGTTAHEAEHEDSARARTHVVDVTAAATEPARPVPAAVSPQAAQPSSTVPEAAVETAKPAPAPAPVSTPEPSSTAANSPAAIAAAASVASVAAVLESASVREIAAVHAISAETAARREAKRAAAAAPQMRQPEWETKVTSLVVLPKPAKAVRPVVALSTIAPFTTSLSIESGWDFTLAHTP